MIINEVIDERTMREIYFPAFEIAVKEAQPWTIMNSYNRINGVYASQNDWLQNKVADNGYLLSFLKRKYIIFIFKKHH